MAEYVMEPGEDQTKVAQELIANAENPSDVIWRPRSGVPHGGVYEVPDDLADKLMEHRRALRDAEAQRIADAQAAADERDSAEGVAEGLLTPAEAGFAANRGTDPGAAVPPADEEASDSASATDTPADEAAPADAEARAAGDEEATKDEAPADEPAPRSRKSARRATATAKDEPAGDSAAEESK